MAGRQPFGALDSPICTRFCRVRPLLTNNFHAQMAAALPLVDRDLVAMLLAESPDDDLAQVLHNVVCEGSLSLAQVQGVLDANPLRCARDPAGELATALQALMRPDASRNSSSRVQSSTVDDSRGKKGLPGLLSAPGSLAAAVKRRLTSAAAGGGSQKTLQEEAWFKPK